MIDTLNLLDLKSKSESIDKALQFLLHNAIHEFGPIPREVYTAVLSSSPSSSLSSSSTHLSHSHSKTLETLTLERLHRLVLTFIHDYKLESGAEHILAIIPREGEGVPKLDAWDIRFKSGRIGARMLDKVLLLSKEEEEEEEDTSINIDGHLWDMFRSFRKIRAGCTMARWVFSMIGHRALCAPSPSPSPSTNSGLSTPIRMTSNSSSNPNNDAPPNLFSTRGSCGRTILTSDTPHNLYDIITREEGRKAVRIDLGLGNRNTNNTITLDDTKYYIPTNTVDDDDPLFDSFTIQREQDNDTVTISFFRFTISESSSHTSTGSGSAGRYEEIRRIVERVRELVEEEEEEMRLSVPMSRKRKAPVDVEVKVAYFLVHPGPTKESQSQPVSWQMPDGWIDEYDGEVFSLRISDPVAT